MFALAYNLGNFLRHLALPKSVKEWSLRTLREKLIKMGYNFVTMTWDTPGQVPIPGMGPKLNGIKLDPLGGGAMIEFMVPQAYEVQLAILDQHGHELRNLLDCMPLAGIYHIAWDGLDDDGDRVKPGRYSCRFTAGDYEEIDRITLKR